MPVLRLVRISPFPPTFVAMIAVLQTIDSRMVLLIPSVNDGWIKISDPRINGIVFSGGKYPR